MRILREVYAELELAYCDLIVLSLNSFASWSCLVNGAVVDHRLHPWCCHLGGYFKHTLLFCRYLCRDIMCKHDVINIQHVHCGLVGPNCKKKSRASTACNRYSYVPSPRLRRVSLTASTWWQRRAAVGLRADMTSSTNQKYVTYHHATRG